VASGLGTIDPRKFIEYAQLAIINRERAKFIFTRHLSDALELIVNWGGTQGLDRDALAHITVQDLLDHLVSPILNDPEIHFKDLIEHRRRDGENLGGIRLGYLIRDPRDLYVVPLHRSTPNFVTTKRIESVPLKLDNQTHVNGELTGRIICIENADPGFDWIFTRGIAGLVSKFGGANSHMTIRCAELGLPAAIGVGEQTFERIASAERVELDGASQLIRPIYG
jgi:phosphohistidine swiveling domain-containing protein